MTVGDYPSSGLYFQPPPSREQLREVARLGGRPDAPRNRREAQVAIVQLKQRHARRKAA